MASNRAAGSQIGSPSKTLLNVAREICRLPHPLVLDVGCGFGRNAVALAELGALVICLDQDASRLRSLICDGSLGLAQSSRSKPDRGLLLPVCGTIESWPIRERSVSAIVCVHVAVQEQLELLHSALVPGGLLYIETFDNRGGNYLELPKAGQIGRDLASTFRTLMYLERHAGPAEYDAVCVTFFGQKIG